MSEVISRNQDSLYIPSSSWDLLLIPHGLQISDPLLQAIFENAFDCDSNTADDDDLICVI